MGEFNVPRPQSKLFTYFVTLLFAIGSISRIAPLFNQGGRLLKQWPTEDGYLMLTIARNLALGRGMSTAAGTIPTNGTQPLFNILEAGGFALVNGDRFWGVAIALILQVAIALAAARALFLLAKRTLKARPYSQEIALLTSALWFSSAVAIPHTMNCLETGLYATLTILSVYIWYRDETEGKCDRTEFSVKAIGIGALLGLTFWARIDAVFLIAALTLWHTLWGLIEDRRQLLRRFLESFAMGITSIVVASPWLINNYINFGSLMPISGTAQSANTYFGKNAMELPSALFEYATIVLPIPNSLELTAPVLLVSSLLVLVYVALAVFAARQMNRNERVLLYAIVTFAAFPIVYYGLFFGAAHFVSRYLFPLSPFVALLTVSMLVLGLLRLSGEGKLDRGLPWGILSLAVLAIVLNFRWYAIGTNHAHFQVVNWVRKNVPEETWVGAIQTGTLGFFHDRTVNLDGKVNPEALAAKLRQQIPQYVIDREFDDRGGRIQYLADWTGIAGWLEMKGSPLPRYFELIVNDPKQNLAVMRRKPIAPQR
jgi:hypothetical protein